MPGLTRKPSIRRTGRLKHAQPAHLNRKQDALAAARQAAPPEEAPGAVQSWGACCWSSPPQALLLVPDVEVEVDRLKSHIVTTTSRVQSPAGAVLRSPEKSFLLTQLFLGPADKGSTEEMDMSSNGLELEPKSARALKRLTFSAPATVQPDPRMAPQWSDVGIAVYIKKATALVGDIGRSIVNGAVGLANGVARFAANHKKATAAAVVTGALLVARVARADGYDANPTGSPTSPEQFGWLNGGAGVANGIAAILAGRSALQGKGWMHGAFAILNGGAAAGNVYSVVETLQGTPNMLVAVASAAGGIVAALCYPIAVLPNSAFTSPR